MQRMMRYNDFKHDPLSQNNGENAIAARSDLNPKDGIYPCVFFFYFIYLFIHSFIHLFIYLFRLFLFYLA
jgi:hypothetical protein